MILANSTPFIVHSDNRWLYAHCSQKIGTSGCTFNYVFKPWTIRRGCDTQSQRYRCCRWQKTLDFILLLWNRSHSTSPFSTAKQFQKESTTILRYFFFLQSTAMKAWKGNSGNVAEAQAKFLQRAQLCSEAAQGKLDVAEFEKCTKPPEELEDWE